MSKRQRIGRDAAIKPSSTNLLLAEIDSKLDSYGPKLLRQLRVTEMQRDEAVRELKFLTDKLVGLLTTDQIEAAKVCGLAPELYAINFIELWREKLYKDMQIECQQEIYRFK